MNEWSILYRGPLSSCNYACTYCPFAKTKNTREELADDAQRLERFVDWVVTRDRSIGVLFTPWGEAMIRKPYQRAFQRLSNSPNVRRVSAQTNLSCSLDWLDACDLDAVALWCTYHPTQTSIETFIERSRALHERGVRHSVGVVGFKDAVADLETLRERLHESTYLWVNAFKRDPDYYSEHDIERFEAIDPLFRFNTRYHASRGHDCRAGWTTFSVDGAGDARRCHFIKDVIGNIYLDNFEARLERKPCTNATCGCHIGYVHMDRLGLYDTFAEGVLERIPPLDVFRRESQARDLLSPTTA